MRKIGPPFLAVTLIGIALLTVSHSRSQTQEKGKAQGLQTNPEWIHAKYGGWSGPGVNPQPGPMDTILLKDWAPKTSVVVAETSVPRASYPAIDVHAHVNARTAGEVADWVKTMDEAGVEMTVILTGATGSEFDRLASISTLPH